MLTSWALALPPSSAQAKRCAFTTHQASRMAAGMPVTPTTPTTTMPLPSYQVSGAGAAPRHAASAGSSIGAFFGVLAAVLVLTVLSCVFGRVCAAQAERPDESYDCTRLALWRPRRAPRRRPPPAAEAKQQPATEGPPLPLPEP
ncbi:hypothetical protein GQ55_4G260900 [Panicum hallii var. hallii]|uniref:Uncharacterized protein n=1 Tax=Panicum hallii var. hallii TaxID=1504633 RepID=A0A2T7E0A9_9POAL|nr:hypothetical protein GQ55_4G260900 [Panicum hallii var. hallii]